MFETTADVRRLQELLDRSMSEPGAHMRSIFKPEHRLTAAQVCGYLLGVFQVAAATATAKGEPLAAPIDAAFYHGKFYLSTDARSVRARHLARRPSVSLTYFEGADPVVIVHGKAAFVRNGQRPFADLDAIWANQYGKSVTEVSDSVVFIRVDARKMFAYSQRPERFAEGGAQ